MKGTYVYYALGEGLARILPKRAMLAFIQACTRLYLAGSPEDLRTVMQNLRGALPEIRGERELKRRAKEVILNFAAYLVDFVYTDRLSLSFIEAHVEKKGFEHLDRALAQGKGVILASAHLGNWELGGMALARLGYPVHGVALKHKDERINRIFERRRGAHGLNIIPFNGNFRNCFRLLKKNGILGLVSDRLFGERGVEVEFFKRRVFFPTGIFRFSRATGAPVIPIFFVRKDFDRYELEVAPPLAPAHEKDLVQSFARLLEQKIRQHPTQWFIFQPYWEAPEWPI